MRRPDRGDGEKTEAEARVDARLDVEGEEALAAVEVRRVEGVQLSGLKDLDGDAVHRQNTVLEVLFVQLEELLGHFLELGLVAPREGDVELVGVIDGRDGLLHGRVERGLVHAMHVDYVEIGCACRKKRRKRTGRSAVERGAGKPSTTGLTPSCGVSGCNGSVMHGLPTGQISQRHGELEFRRDRRTGARDRSRVVGFEPTPESLDHALEDDLSDLVPPLEGVIIQSIKARLPETPPQVAMLVREAADDHVADTPSVISSEGEHPRDGCVRESPAKRRSAVNEEDDDGDVTLMPTSARIP